MSPGQLPMGLGPLMGFILWRIQRGDTPEAARTAAENHRDYTGFTPDQYSQAMYAAAHNAAVTEVVQTLRPDQQLGEATGAVIASNTVFGVRVLLTHTDALGRQAEASVVVNAQAGTSVVDILEAAEDYANSGQLAQHTGHASPGTFGEASILQVVTGGLPGAVLSV